MPSSSLAWLLAGGLFTGAVGGGWLLNSHLSTRSEAELRREERERRHTDRISELRTLTDTAVLKHKAHQGGAETISISATSVAAGPPSDFADSKEVLFAVPLPSSRIRHPCSTFKLKLNQEYITVCGQWRRNKSNNTLIWQARPLVGDLLLHQKLSGNYTVTDTQKSGMQRLGIRLNEPLTCLHVLHCNHKLNMHTSFYVYFTYTMHLTLTGEVVVHPRSVKVEHDCDQLTVVEHDNDASAHKWIVPDATMAGSQHMISHLVEVPMPADSATWEHPLLGKPLVSPHVQTVKNSIKVLTYANSTTVIQRLMNQSALSIKCQKITFRASAVPPVVQSHSCYGRVYLWQTIPFRASSSKAGDKSDFAVSLLYCVDQAQASDNHLATLVSSDYSDNVTVVTRHPSIKDIVRRAVDTDALASTTTTDKNSISRLWVTRVVIDSDVNQRVACLQLATALDSVYQAVELTDAAETAVQFYHFDMAVSAVVGNGAADVRLELHKI